MNTEEGKNLQALFAQFCADNRMKTGAALHQLMTNQPLWFITMRQTTTLCTSPQIF